MKLSSKLMTLGILLACSTSCLEAQAQQKSYVDPNALPRGDQFFKARKKVQIVNENPEITSVMPGPEGKKVMVINQSPQPVPATEFIHVNPGANGGNLPPGYVDLSSPPQARFGTNIPTGGMASPRNRLPSGQSSNGLLNQSQAISGRMQPPGQPAARAASPGAVSNQLRRAPSQEALVYPAVSSGTGGSTGSTTTVGVRGSLLNKTAK